MAEEAGTPHSATREVQRTFHAFARSVRMRGLYGPEHALVRRAIADLEQAFAGLLGRDRTLSLRVRADAFVLDEVRVLEEPDPSDSIPYAFHRDGVRRLELSAGLDAAELDALIGAAAQGFVRTPFGDDVVSYLWRHDLDHVRYVVVDHTLVASGTSAPTGAPGPEVDADIDQLLAAIYGAPTDVGHHATSVDASDFRGKAIAETLDDVDDLAPGFHPARALAGVPSYRDALLAEVQTDEERITTRAALMGLGALAEVSAPDDVAAIGEALLQIYDAELGSGSLRLALPIVTGVAAVAEVPAARARAEAWLAQASGETRLRPVLKLLDTTPPDELRALLMALGRSAAPVLLGFVPTLESEAHRRLVGDVVVGLGLERLDEVAALLAQPSPEAAEEAVRVLSRQASPQAHELLCSAAGHAEPRVRLALLSALGTLPPERGRDVAVALLEDADADVVAAAARALGSCRGDARALAAVEAKVAAPTFAGLGPGLKQALLAVLVLLAQGRAVPALARMLREGDALLARREDEDTAVAAARALGFVRTPGAVTALETTERSLNKRVREATKDALRRAGARP
jgi:HEAT repeat protein